MQASIEFLLYSIDESSRTQCFQLLQDNMALFREAPGSSHNHQAWAGGYLNHIKEVMNIACLLYKSMSKLRELPFSLSDALLVLFLHDLEKPWKYQSASEHPGVLKSDRKTFRMTKIAAYGIELTETQLNALTYVEGEGDDYRSDKRVMNELAAFCHICDIASARIWYDFPRKGA